MRICSFLPSATEVLYSLGLDDDIVGVTYACDRPAEAQAKPVVVRTRLPQSADSAEIDRQVRSFLADGKSLYSVDINLLAELRPDLIITQDLCHVCAASPDDLPAALACLSRKPKILTLAPTTLGQVWVDLLSIGEAVRKLGPAADLLAGIRRRLAAVERALAGIERRPRVLCLEWLNPPYVGGHWVPEMIALAGGEDVLGLAGKPSAPVSWEQVLECRPEAILLCPCGFGLEATIEEFRRTRLPDGWEDLPAVQSRRVWAVDANRCFSRPNHQLVLGVEVVARLLHPDRFGEPPAPGLAAPVY